jgi:hypothetical protein
MTNQQDTSIYRTGDLVIGSSDPGKSVYSSSGAKLIDSGVSIYGSSDDLQEQYKDIVRSATMSGGKKITVSSPKGSTAKAKIKNKKTRSLSDTSQPFDWAQIVTPEPIAEAGPPVKLKSVQFENDFGKIKAKVEHVVEHSQAYLLIFSDEDSLVFEPKVGELLILHTDNSSETVYYPGVTFNSPENTKKFMILFKVPEENQE